MGLVLVLPWRTWSVGEAFLVLLVDLTLLAREERKCFNGHAGKAYQQSGFIYMCYKIWNNFA